MDALARHAQPTKPGSAKCFGRKLDGIQQDGLERALGIKRRSDINSSPQSDAACKWFVRGCGSMKQVSNVKSASKRRHILRHVIAVEPRLICLLDRPLCNAAMQLQPRVRLPINNTPAENNVTFNHHKTPQ